MEASADASVGGVQMEVVVVGMLTAVSENFAGTVGCLK